jgi:hypothetical protein
VGFDGQGQAAGVLPDHASDRTTVENRGTYSVVAALSVSGTAGVAATLRCRKNGVPVAGLRADVTLAAGVQNLAVIGQVGCDQSDVLELWIEAAGSGSLTAASGTFAIARV